MKNIITYRSSDMKFHLNGNKSQLLGIDKIDDKTAVELIEKGYKIEIDGIRSDTDGYILKIPIRIYGETLIKYKDSIIGIRNLDAQILIIRCNIVIGALFIEIYSDKTWELGMRNIFGSHIHFQYKDRLRLEHHPMTSDEVCGVILDRLNKLITGDNYRDTYTFKGGVHNRIITRGSVNEILEFIR